MQAFVLFVFPEASISNERFRISRWQCCPERIIAWKVWDVCVCMCVAIYWSSHEFSCFCVKGNTALLFLKKLPQVRFRFYKILNFYQNFPGCFYEDWCRGESGLAVCCDGAGDRGKLAAWGPALCSSAVSPQQPTFCTFCPVSGPPVPLSGFCFFMSHVPRAHLELRFLLWLQKFWLTEVNSCRLHLRPIRYVKIKHTDLWCFQ